MESSEPTNGRAWLEEAGLAGRMRAYMSRRIAQRDIKQPSLAVASNHQQVSSDFGSDLNYHVSRTAEAKDLRDGHPLVHEGRNILVHFLGHEAARCGSRR